MGELSAGNTTVLPQIVASLSWMHKKEKFRIRTIRDFVNNWARVLTTKHNCNQMYTLY